jgi:PadR family transcriptional regulator PadR
MNDWETQFRKGVVELAVLASIGRGESYGYQIVERLGGHDGLGFTESTVYPALSRMAAAGHLACRTEPSASGPPRRYYRLTDEGRERFRQLAGRWRAVSASLATLLQGAES